VLQLARIWILADRFLIPKLQNQVMDNLYSLLTSEDNTSNFAKFTQIAYTYGGGDNALVEARAWLLAWSSDLWVDYWENSIHPAMVLNSLKLVKAKRPKTWSNGQQASFMWMKSLLLGIRIATANGIGALHGNLWITRG
jgi:hypothetical protein